MAIAGSLARGAPGQRGIRDAGRVRREDPAIEDEPTDSPPADAEPEPPLTSADRRVMAIEVGVILCLAILPSLVTSLWYFGVPLERGNALLARDLTIMVADALQVVLPLLFILWLRREPWRRFGLVRPRPLVDVGGAIVVAVALFAATSLCTKLVWPFFASQPQEGMITGPARPPTSALDVAIVLLFSAANGFREELVMRGYLIPRSIQLGLRPSAAVLATSLVFGAYHLYLGVFQAIQVTVMGLVFAAAFLLFRRLWPIAIAHAAFDAYVLLGL